ncbi:MAG: GrpB family protein [SAR202 cluster bacterium]|nr:GrpB family protein [SAR202 cluster bacterium]
MSGPPVHIVPYDPSWPAKFAEERDSLARHLAPWLEGGIEHIGSTSVPGLAAKPVIDMMAGVRSLEKSRPCIEALTKAGWVYFPFMADQMHWLCKPSDEFRTHHLHVLPYRSARWNARLAFRDYLRAHPEVAAEYQALKLELAEKYREDRETYTTEKGPYIKRIVKLAMDRQTTP